MSHHPKEEHQAQASSSAGSSSSEVVPFTSEARRSCGTVQSASNGSTLEGVLRWFGLLEIIYVFM